MDRRTFLGTLTGGLVVAPLAAAAQQRAKVPVVGVLNIAVGPRSTTVDTTRQGLRDLGYVEGQTIAFDVRFAGGKPEAYPAFAADLVRRKVDVLLVSGPAAVRAATDATSTIPIVALDYESDPVQAGFARSFAQPGGNMTGLFLDQPGLTGKWLGLIGEAAPKARRIAVLRDPTTGPWQLAAIRGAAENLRIELQVLEIRSPGELDHALEVGVNAGSRALVQLSSPLFDNYHKQIADLTTKHRLPAISLFRRFAEAGGLMSYGPNQVEYTKRLAVYIDQILKGAKPADLPIEQPTKFALVINLKTAKALGITMPPPLLLRADEVIQ
jgi:putative tryptophan/tyrosine transport system substrate-binding protein